MGLFKDTYLMLVASIAFVLSAYIFWTNIRSKTHDDREEVKSMLLRAIFSLLAIIVISVLAYFPVQRVNAISQEVELIEEQLKDLRNENISKELEGYYQGTLSTKKTNYPVIFRIHDLSKENDKWLFKYNYDITANSGLKNYKGIGQLVSTSNTLIFEGLGVAEYEILNNQVVKIRGKKNEKISGAIFNIEKEK